MTTDLKYEDVIENAEAPAFDLNKLFNASKDEIGGTKQQRLVFLNKAQQNEKFLEKNVKKFTHLSARWLTVGCWYLLSRERKREGSLKSRFFCKL